jgi:hypothetical protein
MPKVSAVPISPSATTETDQPSPATSAPTAATVPNRPSPA